MEYAPTHVGGDDDQVIYVAVPICNGIRSYLEENGIKGMKPKSQSPSVMEYAPTKKHACFLFIYNRRSPHL